MKERFRRSCHLHERELSFKPCPLTCNVHHTHEQLMCPRGHACMVWDSYDSAQCWRHGKTPKLHRGCVYAVANKLQIVEISEAIEPLDVLLEQLARERSQRTFGIELPEAVGF